MWAPAKSVLVNNGGTWQNTQEVWGKDNGVWTKAFSDLDAASTVDDMKGFVSAMIRGDMNLTSVHMSDSSFKFMLAALDLQEEARDHFNLGQYTERINPWVDILGAMAGLIPDEIDKEWLK